MFKKFLAALICMTAVIGGAGLVSAATSTEAIINYVDMQENRDFVTDENGDDVFVDYTEVVFELKNECGVDMEFAPFVAFYSGARFVDAVRAEALEIATDDTAEFSVTSEVAFAKNADSCKVFVLDDNLVPYSDVAEGELNAYDKNYAYFIRAVAGSDGWKDTIKVQLLDKTGEVYTAYLADKVTLENASEAVLTAAGLGADGDANLAEFADYDNFAELLANQVVTYEANSAGEISSITFPQSDEDDETLYYGYECGENVTYDANSRRIQYDGGTALDVKEDSIIFFINNYDNNVYYDGEVSGFANAEVSTVATREYLSDSIEYDYGMFFNTQEGVAEIIVLYNTTIEREEDIEGEGTTIEPDNYAYFIRAAAGTDGWDDTIKVQLLDKSGEVYTAYLADKVTLENASEAVLTAAGLEADGDANLAEFADYDNFAELLANQLVTYAANNAGEISAITFATTLGDEDTFSLYAAGNATFDEGKREAAIDGKKVTVTDDTIVFFIKGSNTISAIGDTENFADVAYSEVATGAVVNSIAGYAAVYDVNENNDVASVLVILNSTGGISASAPIAVLESIGKTVVDGETTFALTYWMNGEEATSYISKGCIGFNATAMATEMAAGGYVGDLYKFNLAADGTLITEMVKYGDAPAMSDNPADADVAWGFTPAILTGLENVFWGPVVETNDSYGWIKIAQGNPFDFENYLKIKNVSDANVYVVDTFVRSPIHTGTIADAYANTGLIEKDADDSVYTQIDIDKDGVVDVATGVAALGMLDYAVVYTYDDDAVDVIIYKAYDFEYKLTRPVVE